MKSHRLILLLFVLALSACGGSSGVVQPQSDAGSRANGGEAGVARSYPSGTIAFEGEYQGAFQSRNVWTWPGNGCTYQLQPAIRLRLELKPEIMFNQGTRLYEVKEPSEIKIEGMVPKTYDVLLDPTCGFVALKLAGTAALAAGQYPGALTWKGRVQLSRLDSDETAEIDMEFAVNVPLASPTGFDNSFTVDERNVAQLFILETTTKLSGSSRVKLVVGDNFTDSFLKHPDGF